MSRIGKQIIDIPPAVTVTLDGQTVQVKGPKGELITSLPPLVHVNKDEHSVNVSVDNENEKEQRSLWGTWASHIKNMVTGVTDGFAKELEVNGVGYKVALSGKKLSLNVGFSHTVDYEMPQGIDVDVDKNIIRISGIDKQQVGQVASEIRSIKKVEPYKGKGIKYVGEHVRRKAGKAAKGTE